jgi:hypothetical protein
MRVGITGHSKGIGKHLFSIFQKNNFEVVGYSRSNGFDISTDEGRDLILKDADQLDVFINNAYDICGQIKLLDQFLIKWNDPNKFIINISSLIVRTYLNQPDENFKSLLEFYYKSKMDTENLIKSYRGPVKIINIIPGLVDTEFSDPIKYFFNKPGMNPEQLSSLIFDVFKYRNHLDVKELVVEHYD